MSQAFVNGAAVVLEYSLVAVLAFRGFTECYRDGIEILSSGLMFGSGAVMPPLSPESLGLGGLYKAYLFSRLHVFRMLTASSMMALWAVAFTTFVWMNRLEIAA
jgi:hypothetical protein